MKRRDFIGAGLATAGVGILGTRPAFAQSKQIVVTNWGGDWNDRTVKHLEAPLLEEKGWTIVRDLNEEPQRMTKILAEKRLPRGTVDVAHFSESVAYKLYVNETLETIDYSRIPNAATMVEKMKRPFIMPWLYSDWEIVYNPDKIKDPVTAYADLWNPKFAGKIGVMDQNYGAAMQVASLVASGKMNDFDGAKKKLLEWKKAVQPRVYPSHQQAQAALKSDEIWMVGNWKARGLQWQNDGLNVRVASPKEGGIHIVFGVVVPKRAINKDGAYTYLNALLDPAGMRSLCSDNFYAPPTTAVSIPGDIGAKIAFTPAQTAALHYWDQKYWSDNVTLWLDWWKKDFLGS
jgi:putative spermidine/putrescine transport system substrate-binding protein